MRVLNTAVSAVNAYSQKLGSSYMTIAGNADNVEKDVAQMKQRVQQAQENVTFQREQASQLQDEAAAKASYYESLLRSAEAEADAAFAEIQYVLNNPRAVTHEDSEGNTYTTYEVDEAALAAAQSRYDRAMAEVSYYRGKFNDAKDVEYEAASAHARFENLERGITAVNNMIQEQQFRISQNNRDIRAEAGYNLQCMRSILDRLSDYLACKRIYMPERLQ